VETFLTFYAPLIVLGMPILLFFILRGRKKKKDKKREKATDELINSIASKSAGINTKFLETQLFQTVEDLIKSFYIQDPNGLPAKAMSPKLYYEWYEKMKREYELGIKKILIGFEIVKIKVAKQKKISVNLVSHIEVEAIFDVEYDYHHATVYRRIKKKYKQSFIFMNDSYIWYLDQVMQEENI